MIQSLYPTVLMKIISLFKIIINNLRVITNMNSGSNTRLSALTIIINYFSFSFYCPVLDGR